MTRMISVASALLLLLALPAGALGQSCSDVLVPDRTRTLRATDKAAILVSILSQENIQTYDDYKKSSINASVPIDGVLVGGGFERSNRGFRELISKLKTYERLSTNDRSMLVEAVDRLTDASVAAWQTCVTSPGFHVWLEQQVDPHTIVLAAEYRDAGEHAAPRLTNLSFSGPVTTPGDGPFADRNLRVNQTMTFSGATQRQIFKRTSDGPLTLVVSSTVGAGLTKTLGPVADECCAYRPTKEDSGSSVGDWNKVFTFFNDKAEDIQAKVAVTFSLVRESPDGIPSSVKSVTLYRQQGSDWTEVQTSGPHSWTTSTQPVTLTYYVVVPSNTPITFKASIGLWDRFSSTRSGVSWKITY